MQDIRETFREAWANALGSLNAAEQGAEKMIAKISAVGWLRPDELRQHARDIADLLQDQGKEFQDAIGHAVKRAASPFQLPTRVELDALRRRVDAIAARVEALTRVANEGEASQ
ncbi:MAG TPA: phasin family protein [Anaeromyxobacteraceae bacterium]|nr:phasin family protein [Anaeromyxobacteraceae bacterium]